MSLLGRFSSKSKENISKQEQQMERWGVEVTKRTDTATKLQTIADLNRRLTNPELDGNYKMELINSMLDEIAWPDLMPGSTVLGSKLLEFWTMAFRKWKWYYAGRSLALTWFVDIKALEPSINDKGEEAEIERPRTVQPHTAVALYLQEKAAIVRQYGNPLPYLRAGNFLQGEKSQAQIQKEIDDLVEAEFMPRARMIIRWSWLREFKVPESVVVLNKNLQPEFGGGSGGGGMDAALKEALAKGANEGDSGR